MTAEWRPIPSRPGYEVSSEGAIRSWRKGRFDTARPVKLEPKKYGYLAFRWYIDNDRGWQPVHSAVAEAFIGPRPQGAVVRHLDGDHLNNQASNLAYGSVSDNIFDQVRHGTHANASRTHCRQGHPFDDVNSYRRNGTRKRICRTCARERQWRYKTRKALRAAGVAA